MKQIYRSGAVTAMILLAAGCTIEREVDFMAGRGGSGVAAYFGSEAYLPKVETFMQIGRCSAPTISSDGQQVFFTSGLSGVNQLYRMMENGWPYQLTMFPDGISWYVLSPAADMAIVGAASGGSERTQLYLLDTQSGRLRQLTDRPAAIHGSVIWNLNGGTIYFRSNVENLKDFKLYAMNLSDGNLKKLVDAAGYTSWNDISPDGKKLLYSVSTSNMNGDVYLFDIESGLSELLTPHEGDVLYENILFAAGGNSLFLTCNANQSGMMLRTKMNLASRKLSLLDSDPCWNVDFMTLSPDRSIMAWTINEDGYARLRLTEVGSGRELPMPELDGMVGYPSLSQTSRMVFAFESPTQTSDLWSWDFETRRLKQVTHSSYAGIDSALFAAPKLMKYRSFDGLDIPAFLYLPKTYAGGAIPFILDMHGGPESQARPFFNRHFQYLLLRGIGILAPNIRGSSGYGKEYLAMDNYKLRLDAVKDTKAGVDWLIQNGYTAPGMVGIKGDSYGGYIVMAAITEYPDLFSAAVDEVGIVNFVSYLRNTSSYRRDLRAAEYGPQSDTAFLISISPIRKADRIRTPLLVAHGVNDPRVPVDEARQIIAAIQRQGGIVDSLIFPDEGHGVGKLTNRLMLYRKMADFFEKYLRKSP